MGYFILDCLIQFCICLIVAIRQKNGVPAKGCLASRLYDLARRPPYKDLGLCLRTCRHSPVVNIPSAVDNLTNDILQKLPASFGPFSIV